MSGSARRKPGRMAAQIEPFREWLRLAGYTPGSSRGLLMVMGQLGRWMQANVADGEQLTIADLDAFAAWLRSRSARRVPRLSGNDLLRSYLIDAGVVRVPATRPPSEVEVLIDGFRRWMIDERGLRRGRCCAMRTQHAGSSRVATRCAARGSSLR